MSGHGRRSPRWTGHPRRYQAEAQRVYAIEYDRRVLPWSWITTECDEDRCLRPECMTVHAPTKIRYPHGLCTYCGMPGFTKDHLLPEPITGETERRLVATVPACGNCNSRIGDFHSPNVSERRRRAQLSIERTNKHLLLSPHKTPQDLLQLGPMLRSVAMKNNHLRIVVKARLSWPNDPFFDVRAFDRSGIPDPVTIGMCDPIATALRPEYEEAS